MIQNSLGAMRMAYRSFVKDGIMLSEPTGYINKKFFTTEQVELIRELVSLIVYTRIVSKNTKTYFQSEYSTVAKAIAHYNNSCIDDKDRVNIKTAQSSADYDRKKINGIFPDGIIHELVTYLRCDCEVFRQCLKRAKLKYDYTSQWTKQFIIKLPTPQRITETLSEDEFRQMIDCLLPYSMSKVEATLNTIKEVKSSK